MKNIIRYTFFAGAFLCLPQLALAVSMIELKQQDGSTEKIYVKGMQVRIDSSMEPGYVLIDGNSGSMHVVSHEEKQIMDMSGILGDKQGDKQSRYKVEFVKKGSGPKIAGYKTMHYEIRVNGKKCSDEYMSKQMPKDAGIQKAFEKISTMFNTPDMGMMPGMDPCLMAEDQISSQYTNYGYPMRSVDASGKLESEVVRLNKNAKMPSGGFKLPKGYKTVSMGDMMKDMQQQMQSQMRGMPPEAMQGMPPEAMQGMDQQQVEQMQQMMEQMMQQMGERMQQQMGQDQ